MRLSGLAETSEALRETSGRKAKTELLSELLTTLEPAEIVPAIGFLLATPRQGAIGVGWATVARLDATEHASSEQQASPHDPDIRGFDSLLSDVLVTVGTGSEAARADKIGRFLFGCTENEAAFVRRVLVGDARQGALAGVMTDAVAKASGVKLAAMRRAVMLRGDLGEAAAIALIDGADAVAEIDLEVGRPIQPMLASTSAGATEAIDEVGAASVEWKLDGARIQVHVHDGDVSIYTRNLNNVTDRLPQVGDVARSLPCRSAVLDGEVLGFFGDESPQAFQDTMSALGTDPPATAENSEAENSEAENSAAENSEAENTEAGFRASGLRPYFFDLMYLDGESLIDQPLSRRLGDLHRIAADYTVPQLFTESADEAEQHLRQALDRGHEGVMVKAAESVYEAGRRGKSWRKVKPVHTLDLVVLAAEWGHGRRQGWLSNLHLGARDADTGELVMVGKTFKGLTDKLLTWQTEQFQKHRVSQNDYTVFVEPKFVVEIALDGAQSSTRYAGGVALRFARVKAYRPDRDPASADTLDAVRALLPGGRSGP